MFDRELLSTQPSPYRQKVEQLAVHRHKSSRSCHPKQRRWHGQAESLRGSRGRAPMDDLVVDCLRGDRNARLVVIITGGDLLNEINDAAAEFWILDAQEVFRERQSIGGGEKAVDVCALFAGRFRGSSKPSKKNDTETCKMCES
jgi:hypothetical protein